MALVGALGLHLDPLLGYNFVISLLDTSSKLALAKSITKNAVLDVAVGTDAGVVDDHHGRPPD